MVLKWFIGVSSGLIIGAIAWASTFIMMGYQAQADITELKTSFRTLSEENASIKAEVKVVRATTERTEKNTEQIRNYLLHKAIK